MTTGSAAFALLVLAPYPLAAQPVFADVTASAGLGRLDPHGVWDGAGVAVLDADGDGDPDLVLPAGKGRADWLCRNDGTAVFDCTELPTCADRGGVTTGVAHADFDGDGGTDLWLARYGRPCVLRGLGGSFADATASWLPDAPEADALGLAVGDVDGDGGLDVYVASAGVEQGPDARDHLWMWRGERFVAGQAPPPAKGAAVTGQAALLYDRDEDGDLDLYRAGDQGADAYWDNDGGGFRFRDDLGPGFLLHTMEAMGIAPGDFDNDGDVDLYLSDGLVPGPDGTVGNTLYQAEGGSYRERARAWGLGGFWSWGCQWADFDHDGMLDLALGGTRVCVFHNRGERFEPSCPLDFGDDHSAAVALAASDLDADGDPDLVVHTMQASAGGPGWVRLLRNDMAEGHWLKLLPRAARGPRAAIGARVIVTAGARAQRRDVYGPQGKGSQPDGWLHFGLGQATGALVAVRWLGGPEEDFGWLDADRSAVLVEGTAPPDPPADADAGRESTPPPEPATASPACACRLAARPR